MDGYRFSDFSLFPKESKLVERLKDTVRQAMQFRKKIESDWAENVKMLNGDFWDWPDFGLDRVQVNMFWATVRSMGPSLYMQDPDILTPPKRAQDVDSAAVMEAAINYWLPKMQTTDVMHELIPDALCCSFAVCKSGYVLNKVQAKVTIDHESGSMELADESQQVDLAEHSIELRDFMVGSHPCLNRVSPFNFYVDWKATGPHNAEWVFERIYRNIEEVKGDPAYENTRGLQPTSRYVKDGLWQHQYYQPTAADFFSGQSSQGPWGQNDRGFDDIVELFEFWHRPTRKLYTLSPFHPKLLRSGGWPYEHAKFPYHDLMLTVRVPDKLYPMPFLSAIKPQASELNKLRTYSLAFVKRAITRFFINSNMFDNETLEAFKSGKVAPVVPVDGDPKDAVYVLEGSGMGPETHKMIEDIKDDMRVISQIQDFQQPSSETTATSQKLISNNQNVAIGWMQRQVLRTVRDISSCTMANLKQFADLPQMIKITGRSDFPWREFTRDDIQGEYDCEVKPGTQLMQDRQMLQKGALDLFNLLVPVGLQTGKYDVDELTLDVLKTFPHIRDPSKILKGAQDMNKPPNDPAAENILLSIGGMPKISPNDPDDMHIQVHQQGQAQAKTQEEAYRWLAHIQEHEKAKMMKMAMAMMQAQQQAGMQPPGQGGPPSPPPGGGPPGSGRPPNPPQPPVQGGQGRPGAQPGFPMAPRQMSEKPATPDGMARAQSRRETN